MTFPLEQGRRQDSWLWLCTEFERRREQHMGFEVKEGTGVTPEFLDSGGNLGIPFLFHRTEVEGLMIPPFAREGFLDHLQKNRNERVIPFLKCNPYQTILIHLIKHQPDQLPYIPTTLTLP